MAVRHHHQNRHRPMLPWMMMMMMVIVGLTTVLNRPFLQPSYAWSTSTLPHKGAVVAAHRHSYKRNRWSLSAEKELFGQTSSLSHLSNAVSTAKTASSSRDLVVQRKNPSSPTTKDATTNLSRRKTLQSIVTTTITVTLLPMLLQGHVPLVESAAARNLPTSTGADTSQTGTLSALLPIVALRQSLERVQLQRNTDRTTTTTSNPTVSLLLERIPQQEVEFKRLFDTYSDRVSYKQTFMDQNAFLVYYSKGFDGPGRPTLEEGGLENERQTLQFGARNDSWIAWEACLVEFKYLDKDNDFDVTLAKTIQAVDSYLALAPPQDVKQAKERLLNEALPL